MILSLFLNAICLGLLIWLIATSESRMQDAAVSVIIDGADDFYQVFEQAVIEKNKERFADIYRDLGVEYAQEPQSIGEMLQPLSEIITGLDGEERSVPLSSPAGAEQVDPAGRAD